MVKKISILGTKVSIVNWGNVMEEIGEILKKKKQIFITTPNPEHIVEAWENKTFQNIINNCDLAIPDGIGLVWAMKRKLKKSQNQFFHRKHGILRHDKLDLNSVSSLSRVTGVDLMDKLCELSKEKKWKVGLLGGIGDVGLKTKKVLEKKYKGLVVEFVGSHSNVLDRSKNEDNQIIQNIKSRKVKVLFVAYGAPKQELIISEYIKILPEVKIFMGVGGAFDFFSERIKRAPKWMQKLGLEWLNRLVREPWRWKRQLKLFKFVWLVLNNK